MLEINPGLIVWTIITFILLFLLLKKFAWKPLLQSLQNREEHIRVSIEQAEQAKQEAQHILEENRKQLAQAGSEVQRILNEGRTFGEKLKNEIVDKANQQSRRMIDQAKDEIERNKQAAIAQLRGEVANLAINAAEKIIEETLDENKHRKIVDAYLNGLPKN
jgi:F-type H+-transporting ATPase subunit b